MAEPTVYEWLTWLALAAFLGFMCGMWFGLFWVAPPLDAIRKTLMTPWHEVKVAKRANLTYRWGVSMARKSIRRQEPGDG